MFLDLALTYHPDKRRCDLTLGDEGDLVFDTTPVPAMLMSVGLDRRADPDDELPEGRSQFLTPASYSERRGAVIDALNPRRRHAGCKLWQLDRAKQTETTRQLCEYWLAQSLAWAREETGEDAQIDVFWARPGLLAYRVGVQDETITLSRRVDA